jgi:membrane protease YdiL (CAAX protease family)
LLTALGLAIMIAGPIAAGAVAGALQSGTELTLDVAWWLVAAVAAGALLALIGLSLGAYRSIRLRRDLGADRYRGPSVIALLAMVVLAQLVALIPFLGGVVDDLIAAAESGAGEAQLEQLATQQALGNQLAWFVLLISTGVLLLVVTVVFVVMPRALPGVPLLRRGGLTWRDIGRRLFRGLLIGVPAWLVGMLVYLVLLVVLAELIGPPSAQDLLVEQIASSLNPLVTVLAVVVVAPIAEEVFFRGVVYNAWEREYGYRRALLGSALLFGIVHLSLYNFGPIFLLGLLLAYVYARTRSLLTVVAVHATFNAISTALLYLAPSIPQ